MGKPKIRFKGYTTDWEQRKVLDLLELLTDYDANGSFADMAKNVNTADGDGYAWYVRITDLENPKPLSELKYVDESSYKFLKKTELHGGELLMAKRGDIGKVYIFEPRTKYATVAPNMYLLKLNDKVIPHFLYDYFVSEEGNKKLTRLNASSTMGALYKDDVKNIDVIMPSIEEQDMIGNFFQSIDHLITLHQRKYEEMKTLKRYMLQKMFPQSEQKVPEIRFAGFTEDWEQRKLSDIYDSIGNAFVRTATPYYAEQGYFYLESNNVKDGQINHNSEVFINDEFYEKQKDKWLHTGDMVMVQSGHVGHAAVIPEELDNTAAHALIMFRNPKEEIEPYFLNYEYQTDKAKKKIENITTGNTIKHILASDMQEFVVDVPKYEEQKVIAGYFRNIDHLITLHQQKCEELKNIKKFMLQNMFV